MGKRLERYKQNHDLGPQFVFITDGKGGLILPAEAMERLKNGKVTVDGIAYPYVVYQSQKYAIVETSQGWTLGGKVAEKQHARNVAAAKRTAAKRAA
jgi:hypothetical protein